MSFFRFDDFKWSITASMLNRKLLFVGHKEATDYLNNSPLNRHLYKFFIDTLPQYQMDVPIVKFFNEIYYQCVRVNYDGTPGVDIEKRYIAEETEWLNSELASKLIFSIVWAVMSSKRNLTFHEECFLLKLTPYVKSCDFHIEAERVLNDIRQLGLNVPEEYPAMTGDIFDLPLMDKDELESVRNNACFRSYSEEIVKNEKKVLREYLDVWRTVTTNYSHYAIEKYLRLFSNTKFQRHLVHLFEVSCRYCPHDSDFGDYLCRLENSIMTGDFELKDTPTIPTENTSGCTPDEYDDYLYNLALDRAASNEELTREEQLQRDCENLKRLLEEHQRNHELEMARVAAEHEAEIKRLKSQFADGKSQTTKKDKAHKGEAEASAETSGQMFSVEEMIAYVKNYFEMASAKDFCIMCYRIAEKHGKLDGSICELLAAIESAIRDREAHRQTINIPTAQQVNINPKEVVNHTKEE